MEQCGPLRGCPAAYIHTAGKWRRHPRCTARQRLLPHFSRCWKKSARAISRACTCGHVRSTLPCRCRVLCLAYRDVTVPTSVLPCAGALTTSMGTYQDSILTRRAFF